MTRKSFTPSPVLKTDFYKQGHKPQYPTGTNLVFTNLTARGSRVEGLTKTIHFGTQAGIQKIDEDFHDNFFSVPKEEAVGIFKRRLETSLGIEVDTSHIAKLHDLGYLPICVYALPEGVKVPVRVPVFCIFNTADEFFWLTNFLETTLSANTWGPMTSATTANIFKEVLTEAANETNPEAIGFVGFQGHDFSYRGMFGDEAACQSGGGHLTSFTGTDTIPAIDWVEHYYDVKAEDHLIGASVWATEHSCTCLGAKDFADTTPEELEESHPYWSYLNSLGE